MPGMGRILGYCAGGAAVIAIGAGLFWVDGRASVGAGYKAKILCSEVFVAHRDPDAVEAAEFTGIDPSMKYLGARIDREAHETHVSLFGLGARTAVYRPGAGCTLKVGKLAQVAAPEAREAPSAWPSARKGSPEALSGVDYDAIERALDAAFTNDPEKPANTRAVVVIKDGKLIAERYADGFNADTPLLSWSMAKSVTQAMTGILVREGLLNVDAPAPVPEWRGENDPRAAITLDDLLRMSSGLEFNEDYDATHSDALQMLYETRDMGGYAASKPLVHKPGEVWSYSSGTANLISRIIRQTLNAAGRSYYDFARRELFDPLGMASAVIEPDPSGTFVGSSYVYATARDWARFGELYLQDGVWNGRRILPEGWAAYAASVTEPSNGQYGAQFWLNREPGKPFFPGLPEDVYMAAGHEGQYVVIIPDKNVVIVRLGMTRAVTPVRAVAPMMKAIYDAL